MNVYISSKKRRFLNNIKVMISLKMHGLKVKVNTMMKTSMIGTLSKKMSMKDNNK
jgi:hypothetical protein